MTSRMKIEEVRSHIKDMEIRSKQLRIITEKQELETYDSDEDGCASCFDPRTEEMMELEDLESTLNSWRTSLAFFELYQRQPEEIKDNDDVAAVWSILRRRFAWATGDERRGYCAVRLEKAATRAMYSPHAAVHEFMCELVHIQNRTPLGYLDFLPKEFMRTVVRLGLMDRETMLKVDAPATAQATATEW